MIVCAIKMALILYGAFFAIFLQYANSHIIKETDITLEYDVDNTTNCAEELDKFQMIQQVKLSDCVIECALRNHCAVMNYHPNFPLCELFGTERPPNDRIRSKSKICIRVKQKDIAVSKSPCDNPCVHGKTCDRKLKNCVFKECLQEPIINNGVILGNKRSDGSKVIFKCNDGYTLTSKSNTAVCQNGQWNRQGSCILEQVIGARCRPQLCFEKNGRCLVRPYNGTKEFCHCQFGFKYVQSTDSCIEDCDQYSSTFDNNHYSTELFIDHNYILKKVKNANSINDISHCFVYCVQNAPKFLSYSFNETNSFLCICRSVSIEQYMLAHGQGNKRTEMTVYDRPCSQWH